MINLVGGRKANLTFGFSEWGRNACESMWCRVSMLWWGGGVGRGCRVLQLFLLYFKYVVIYFIVFNLLWFILLYLVCCDLFYCILICDLPNFILISDLFYCISICRGLLYCNFNPLLIMLLCWLWLSWFNNIFIVIFICCDLFCRNFNPS